MGCNGGLMDNAFIYAESNKLEIDSDYPYTAVGGSCNYDSSKGVAGDISFVDVTPDSPTAL